MMQETFHTTAAMIRGFNCYESLTEKVARGRLSGNLLIVVRSQISV